MRSRFSATVVNNPQNKSRSTRDFLVAFDQESLIIEQTVQKRLKDQKISARGLRILL